MDNDFKEKAFMDTSGVDTLCCMSGYRFTLIDAKGRKITGYLKGSRLKWYEKMRRLLYSLFYRVRKLFDRNAIYVWQKGDDRAAEND